MTKVFCDILFLHFNVVVNFSQKTASRNFEVANNCENKSKKKKQPSEVFYEKRCS